jgi:anti-sigma B factor antagonist
VRIELTFAVDIPIIRLSGRFIAGGDGPFLRQKVADLIEAGTRKMVIDFADVPYLDSTGLGFLAGSQKVAQAAGAKIVLTSLNQHVRKVLDTAKLVQFFALAASEKEALEALQAIPDAAPDSVEAAPPAPATEPAPAKPARGRKRAPAAKSEGNTGS